MSLSCSEALGLDAWVSCVIPNHPSSVFEDYVFCLLWCQLWSSFHLPVQWEVHFHEVGMSGSMVRNLVFGLPALNAVFPVQGVNVHICLTWATVQDFFVALPIKRICAIEQLICISDGAQEVWMQSETGSESKPILQATSGSYLRKVPKTVLSTDAKYMCWDFKKEITLLSISWFHSAISVTKNQWVL